MPTSRPVENFPQQPQYGLAELNLYKRHTRESYLKDYGEQAPPWDKSKPIKRWFASGLTGDYKYGYFVGTQYFTRTISAEEAASINLPGNFVYEKRVLAPSGISSAIVNEAGDVIGQQTIPPEELATLEEATALAAELHATGLFPMQLKPFLNTVQGIQGLQIQPWESRRMYLIQIGSYAHSVGRLLVRRYERGYLSPGHWSNINGQPVWVSEIPEHTFEWDPRPEVPIPQRQLADNEALVETLAGPVVRRTDSEEAASIEDSKLMPQRVAEILKRVKQLQGVRS